MELLADATTQGGTTNTHDSVGNEFGERSGVSPPVPRFCTGKLTHAARHFSQASPREIQRGRCLNGLDYSTTTFTATGLLMVEPLATWARTVRFGISPGVDDSGIVRFSVKAD